MRNYLKPIAYASLFAILLVLKRLSFINNELAFPLAAVITLFILAAIIYNKEGFQKLKIFLIGLGYICIAGAILFTSGIENLPEPWMAIAAILLMTIAAILFVFTIIKLNLLSLVIDDEGDVWLK